jgi:hypothetical protein
MSRPVLAGIVSVAVFLAGSTGVILAVLPLMTYVGEWIFWWLVFIFVLVPMWWISRVIERAISPPATPSDVEPER